MVLPESRSHGCLIAAGILMDGLWSGVGATEESTTTRDTTGADRRGNILVSPSSSIPITGSSLSLSIDRIIGGGICNNFMAKGISSKREGEKNSGCFVVMVVVSVTTGKIC